MRETEAPFVFSQRYPDEGSWSCLITHGSFTREIGSGASGGPSQRCMLTSGRVMGGCNGHSEPRTAPLWGDSHAQRDPYPVMCKGDEDPGLLLQAQVSCFLSWSRSILQPLGFCGHGGGWREGWIKDAAVRSDLTHFCILPVPGSVHRHSSASWGGQRPQPSHPQTTKHL